MSGRLFLTFDDRHIDSWVAARPILDAAGARATFFVMEADELDDRERAGLGTLLHDGHAVGSHGMRHRNADTTIDEHGDDGYLALEIDPSIMALRELGATARCFAYPNSRRSDATDAVLLRRFTYLRGGGPRTADLDEARIAVIPSGPAPRVLPSRGVDTGRGAVAHLADADTLTALLRCVADHDASLVLYAHDIAARSDANHLHPARLAEIVAEARALGLAMHTLDDLPDEGSTP
ncbi:polysaccharide deacetylase family protein [Microbacterium nymphoidis]|uniref:polysaccharide deacetylase family protein n=1 Tax=Microbacterium nymphoidis TaxID=2898586 RepID=UPI001E5C8E4F|nr:polysaccharide deacetylase family protein [Microbacterium nymphoidis]MCD2498538.1 polysaccharide deacetylase family protein [Microbacterium nymphoidis]